MIWCLVLCPDNAKQDLMVYGAEFGVVFLAKGSRTGYGKREARIDCSMVISETTAPVIGTTSGTTGPMPADSRKLLLFLTFSVQPERTALHGNQSRSWSAEQGKENKIKSLAAAAAAAAPPPRCSLLTGKNKNKNRYTWRVQRREQYKKNKRTYQMMAREGIT